MSRARSTADSSDWSTAFCPSRLDFGDHAGDVAGAAGRDLERFVEQGGEARQPLAEIGALAVEFGDHGLQRHPPVGHGRLGTAVALVEQRHGFRQRAPMRLELIGERGEIAEHASGHLMEVADMLFDLGAGGAAALGQFVHGGDEIGDPRHHRVLDRVHVFVGPAQHLLQQDVGLAQTLEQGRGVGAQHAVGFQHFRHGGGGGLLRLLDGRTGGVFEVLHRAREHGRGRGGGILRRALQRIETECDLRGRGVARLVDDAGDLFAVVHHRLRKGEALGIDRTHRMLGDAGHLVGELLTLAAERIDEHMALFIENTGQFLRPRPDRMGDLVG